MYGAILGDIIGSPYEWHNLKSKEFDLFGRQSGFTDDTVMTVAVADALMQALDQGCLNEEEGTKELLVDSMHRWGRTYPNAGYGGRFLEWLMQRRRNPYYSFGNGSGMRVSSVGWLADNIEEVRKLAKWSAEVTHDHPEGIKGAEAIASAIFLARMDHSKEEIKAYITSEFHYDLDRSCDQIRPGYEFDVSCQGSVPEAIIAFLEGNGFEDVIRNAISLGGDSDTIGAMAGSIAEAYYGVPEELQRECRRRLPEEMREVLRRWEHARGSGRK